MLSLSGGRVTLWLVAGTLGFAMAASAQAPQKQEIPDAPSAVRPTPPPSQIPQPEPEPGPQDQPPPPQSDQLRRSDTQPSTESNKPQDAIAEPPQNLAAEEPAAPAAASAPSPADDLFKLKVNVNLVLVPVTVKDGVGHLVTGLSPKDFALLENGVRQQLKFFTSDPFPLSAAVILDLGMPDVAVQKVNQTFASLAGAFSPFDELSLYTYSNRVSQASDFSMVNQHITAALNRLKLVSGANNGAGVASGPLGSGPVINGRPLDPNGPIVNTPTKISRVLNDAILQAARDLSKRERTRRKIIFIISDGHEYGSTASYSDVLKVLLTNDISVYAIGVEGAAIPGVNRISKLHLPFTGYTDILPKYTNATGGWVYNELSRQAIDSAYARITGEARNQYTLGYSAKAAGARYRQIEVRVRRPDVNVYAKDGYYPLPQRQ